MTLHFLRVVHCVCLELPGDIFRSSFINTDIAVTSHHQRQSTVHETLAIYQISWCTILTRPYCIQYIFYVYYKQFRELPSREHPFILRGGGGGAEELLFAALFFFLRKPFFKAKSVFRILFCPFSNQIADRIIFFQNKP